MKITFNLRKITTPRASQIFQKFLDDEKISMDEWKYLKELGAIARIPKQHGKNKTTPPHHR
jgi:hypothetical protein